MFIDRDDRQNETIFGEVSPVADNDVLHHLVESSGIDADPAHGYTRALARAVIVQLQRFAGLDHERLFQTRSAQVLRERGMLRELPVLAVYRQEISRPH